MCVLGVATITRLISLLCSLHVLSIVCVLGVATIILLIILLLHVLYIVSVSGVATITLCVGSSHIHCVDYFVDYSATTRVVHCQCVRSSHSHVDYFAPSMWCALSVCRE